MDVVPINVDVMRRGLIDPESCLADPWGPMSPVSSVQMMRCLLVLTRSVPSKDAKARCSFSKSGGRLRGDVCRPHEGALFYDIG
jgi:hypothetical protein